MSKYKLTSSGVTDTENNLSIVASTKNMDWMKYQEWLAEGNIPDPEFTEEELDRQEIQDEIQILRMDMKRSDVWLFRMLLELFEVGKTKGVWTNMDFSDEIKQRASAWKVKLDRLIELGDN